MDLFEPRDHRHQEIVQSEPFKSDGIETRLHTYDPESEGMQPEHPLDTEQAILRHQKLLGLYINELDYQQEQRAQMREDERFFDGNQWDEGDANTLRSRGQMPLVFNVIAPAVNWITGTERQNRSQYKILPREKNDGMAARLKTDLMKYVDDANNSEYERSMAFADAVKVGIGWIEEGWQGDSGGEPVFVRAESWRNILWDSKARRLDLGDARFIFRAKWVDSDIAARLFPGARNQALIQQATSVSGDIIGSLLTTGDEAMDAAETSAALRHTASMHGVDRGRVRLIEAWYRTHEERPYMQGGQFSGELFDVKSPGHMETVNSGKGQIRWRTAMTIRVAIFAANGLLYDAPSPYRHNRFPFTPVWGNRRGEDQMPYGVIRNLKDIQRDINKRHSKATHILNSSKVIMEEGAVADLDEFMEEVARPDAVLVKKPGKELSIDYGKELGAAQLDLMSRSIQMVQQTSGITDEAMGRQTNANSGKAIIARQQQGAVATAHFLDNLRLALRLSGEKQLSLIEQFYTDEKAFRITNARGKAAYMKINDGMAENDILRTKADFIIAEDAWRATQRQAAMQELMEVMAQIAPGAPQAVMVILDLLVEAMDIPSREEIVARIRSITGMTDPDMTDEEKAADPEQIARAEAAAVEAQMAQRAAEAELGLKEATAAEKMARADLSNTLIDRAKAETSGKRMEAQSAAIQAAADLLAIPAAAAVADQLLDAAEGTGDISGSQSPVAPNVIAPEQQPIEPPPQAMPPQIDPAAQPIPA